MYSHDSLGDLYLKDPSWLLININYIIQLSNINKNSENRYSIKVF